VIVHDVEMHEIGPGIQDGADVLAEAGKVRRQY
jgi:hypothetical protein